MLNIKTTPLYDFDSIKELADITRPQACDGILSTEQIDYLDDVNYLQENCGCIFFIAAQDKQQTGFACVMQEGPDLFHMPKIYVRAEYQQHGTGKALLSCIEQYIRTQHAGPCVLELNISRRNRSYDFYTQQAGFAKVRERVIRFDNGFEMLQDVLQKVL